MSKEKKNRFYYSKKQNDIDEEMWNIPTRFTFVKTPDGWKQYSEWCSVKGVKCNWEDAELVYETDEEPEIIVHSEIPEFINEQQAKISDLKAKLAEKNKKISEYMKEWEKDCDDSEKEIEELKQQLAEKDVDLSLARNEIDTLKHNLNISQKHDNVMCEQYFEKCKKANQDKISFAVEKLEELKKFTEKEIKECNKLLQEEFEDDYYIQSVNARQSMCYEFKREIDNQIKTIKGETK